MESNSGNFDFSNNFRNIDTVICGSYTPTSNTIEGPILSGYGSNYIPRLAILYATTNVVLKSSIQYIYLLGMSENPYTEYSTGPVDAVIISGQNYFVSIRDNGLLGTIDNNNKDCPWYHDATNGGFKIPTAYEAVFSGGITYYYIACFEKKL